MLSTLKKMVASGAMMAAAAGYAAPAMACDEPELSRIVLYEELGNGRHAAIGDRQIQLFVHDAGPDHFDFEVKGVDQYGRFMNDFEFSPQLLFPGGGEFGTLQPLSGFHFRFHTGQIPVADIHVTVRDAYRRYIGATLHLGIAPPPVVVYEPEPVVVYQPQPSCHRHPVVVTQPVYVQPQPVGYYIPPPQVVVEQPRPYYRPVRRSHSGFGFNIRVGDGSTRFGFFGYGQDD